MLDWYWDKQTIETKTPSIQDGMSYATEYRYRKEGARFIITIGTAMDLGYNTLATGVVFFQRFYMFHSFKKFSRYVTAACCLFLAGKVEETPKKCKDIIKIAQKHLSEEKFATFGIDPKEEVMTLEKILLQTIKFDFKVQHPYSYLTKYAKCIKGDKIKLQKMVQMAWTFINDSLCTTLSVEWEPEIIAVSVIYLAGKLSKFDINDWSYKESYHLHWWDLFVEDLNINMLEDVCHQILDLYSPPKEKQDLATPDESSINTVHLPTAPSISNLCTIVNNITIIDTNNASQPEVSTGVIFTNTSQKAIITSTTNSISTIATPMISSRNIKIENVPPQSNLLPNIANKAVFPWSVLPQALISKPTEIAYSPYSKSLPIPLPNLSIPPPNINLINLHIKQENSQNSENDSPLLNSSIKQQVLKTMMGNEAHNFYVGSQNNKSFINQPNSDSTLEDLSSSYFQDNSQKNTGFPNMFKRKSQYNSMFRHSNNRNFHSNWDICDRAPWDIRESNWDVKNMKNDNRGYRQNSMNNFRRNWQGPMKNSKQFFKN